MQYLKHCLDPKVIAALVVVAAAIWVAAPGAFAAATWPREPVDDAAGAASDASARR